MALAPATRLGPYEIIAPLGAGGMGEVYRALDRRLDRTVAIKILSPQFADDPARRERFEREAKAVAALSHPNILAIHDVGSDALTPGSPVIYAVTELLEGETLRERLATDPPPARKAVEIAVQIAGGLAVAHEKGIVHRDLKPENVFITTDGRVKILDFGLATQATPRFIGPRRRRRSRSRPIPGPCSVPSVTCRPSRFGESVSITAPTSSHWARCSTRC